MFITTLHYYYGLEHKDRFQELFGRLYIGGSSTELANTYLILNLEFSRIDTATHESTYRGFLSNVLYGASIFLGAYKQFFTEEQKRVIENGKSPEEIIKSIFRFAGQNQVPHRPKISERTYPDIFLERIPGRNIQYKVVLELKYVKKSAEKTLQKVAAETETQLAGYMAAERFSRPDIRGFYVVFFGGAVHAWGESGKY